MRKLKLFPKTFLYTIAIMSIIVVFTHGLMYIMLPNFYLEQKQTELKTRADELVKQLQSGQGDEVLEIAKQYAVQHNVNITLEKDGDIHRYQGFTPIDIYFDPKFSEKNPSSIKVQPGESSIDASSSKVIIEERAYQQSNRFYLMLNIQPVDESRQVVLKLLPYSIAISFVISLLAASVYSSIITRPIKNILRVTKDMERLKKDSYYQVETEDEIGLLGENINRLYDTLWHTIESLEQKINDISAVEKEKIEFLRAASHELKTPLTSLSILLENMQYNVGKYENRDVYLAKASEMVMDTTKLVQHILNTSKLQTLAQEQQIEWIDVREVLSDTIASYEIVARAKDVNIHIELEETCTIKINREALEKVFSNLVANAIHYTDSGKSIWIHMKNGSVRIENECKPLSEEVLSQIFKAFYRPDFSRNKKDGGTGLGLYIVASILTNEEIEYTFTPSAVGMEFIIHCCNDQHVES